MTKIENSSIKPFCGILDNLQLSLGLRNLGVEVTYSLNPGSKVKEVPPQIIASCQKLQTIVFSIYIEASKLIDADVTLVDEVLLFATGDLFVALWLRQ
jgi:hypothetical protein